MGKRQWQVESSRATDEDAPMVLKALGWLACTAVMAVVVVALTVRDVVMVGYYLLRQTLGVQP